MGSTMPALSLLVVEDEAITLEALALILAKKYPNVAVHAASNGRAGLELFKTHSPGIVITDINMPEMGGVEMADKMHAINPAAKFIVLTGDPGMLFLGASVGNRFKIDHHIDKPVDFLDLFAAIDQCMSEIGANG